MIRWRWQGEVRTKLLAFVLPVLVGAGTAALADKSAVRDGRVVRIERPRLLAAKAVRGCLSFTSDATRFTCFGGEPEPGDVYRVVDADGQIGLARVVRADPSIHDQCQAGLAHDVELQFEHGRPRALSSQGLSIPVAVSGIDADGYALKLLGDPTSVRSPSGRQNENVWIALDRSGNGSADFVATAYEDCEEATASPPSPPAGSRVHGLCLDYWAHDGDEWRLVNREVFYNCYSY